MLGISSYGRVAYGTKPTYGLIKKILIEVFSLTESFSTKISLFFTEVFTLSEFFISSVISNIAVVFTEALKLNESVVRKIDGLLLDIWNKTAKLVSSWTKAEKTSTIWTKEDKNVSGFAPSEDSGFIDG